MKYLLEFDLASERDEHNFILHSNHPKLNMTCYSDSLYPFRIFPDKGMCHIEFEEVTIFCGSNGSGKSTLLNIMANKLGLRHDSLYNETPLMEEYLGFCDYDMNLGRRPPSKSRIITSDDVFDYMLNIRSLNKGVDLERERLFDEYYTAKNDTGYTMRTLDDYDELKRRNEIRRSTKSAFTGRRLPENLITKSNGESAYRYFTHEIDCDALYLLDEPENSLSAKLQAELKKFIIDSARFYNCQFVISTHSPFLLSIPGAKIYDLDSSPVCEKEWTELEAVKIYRDLFVNQ